MGQKGYFHFLWMGLVLLPFVLVAGCGGGGGGESISTNPSGGGSTSSTTSEIGVVSGTAVKGPVSGATMIAFSLNADGTKGSQIGSAQTDGQGNFSIPVGNHSGPVMLQMTGGSYLDEATGLRMNMEFNDALTCMIPQMSVGSVISGIQVTPLTSMAQSMALNMPSGMNPSNMTQANHSVGGYFGVNDILTTHPMDPTAPGSGANAAAGMRNHGMILAAMSQYAVGLGMPQSTGMVTAMMNDASDGRMDGFMAGQGRMGSGMMGSNRIEMGGGMMAGTMMSPDAGTKGLADAMDQFINSPMNRSGLTVQDMQNLMDKLRASNGQIQ